MSGLAEIGPDPDIPVMAAQIRAAWRSAVNSILMTGALMHHARMGLNKDQWRALLALLPFSIRWVQMLTAIGADLRLTKHASFLPSDAYTLYQLTRLSDNRFNDLIALGHIHPTMRRGERLLREAGLAALPRGRPVAPGRVEAGARRRPAGGVRGGALRPRPGSPRRR